VSKVRPILILSDASVDAHISPVKDRLESRGERVYVIDPGEFAHSAEVWCEFEPKRVSRGIRQRFRIDLNRVKSVWYRRPNRVRIPPDIHEDYKAPLVDEWTAFLRGLWDSLSHCRWVNPPSSIRRAESKVSQFYLARRIGFDMPKTLITNSAEKARAFFRQVGERMVAKKIYSHGIAHRDGSASLLVTKLIEDISTIPLDQLKYCPCIFQEYIEKQLDLRVTVIGRDLFAVGIESQSLAKTKVDWRAGLTDALRLKHTPFEIPQSLASKCFRMLSLYGLLFGAFDFAVTGDGRCVFLELNPNGQWLWLQALTPFDMVGSMCDLLDHSVPLRMHRINPLD
jgi:glutathione synthase/RimK-type ligase-like ATP-grasp enzyme